MTDSTEYQKIFQKSKTLLKQSLALLAKCFNEQQRSQSILQRSQAILRSIRNQPWYKPQMASLHQKTLLDGEMSLQKTKALRSRIQDYLDSLPDPTVPDMEQVRQIEQEAQVLLKDLKQILRSYQLLAHQAQLTPDQSDEQCLASVNSSLFNIEEINTWVREMRQKYDPVYQQQSSIYALIEKIRGL